MSSNRRRATAAAIRENVEAYDGMSPETFTRRFYADREELARLGIEIEHDESGEPSGGRDDGIRYWLPPENYFLPAIDFSHGELLALNSCLALLDGQFAYSDLLRIALQSLALGSGNTLENPDTDCMSINLLPSEADTEVASRLSKIEPYIGRKTLRFDYHALGRDRKERRTVDPYRLLFVRSDWYLVGYSHERGELRVFRLRRIMGNITKATVKERDFRIPADFDAGAFSRMEPWQLGPVKGTAAIRIAPRLGWKVARALAGCGTVDLHDDGSVLVKTDYADEHALLSLVLGMADDALIEEPAPVRRHMRAALERIAAAHEGQAAIADDGAAHSAAAKEQQSKKQAAGGRQPGAGMPRQVKPERFIQLATLIAYLNDRLGEQESMRLPARDVYLAMGYLQPKEVGQETAVARAAKRLRTDLELLSLVCIETGGYVVEGYLEGDTLRVERSMYGDLMRHPAHLSPLEAHALLLATDLVGGYIMTGENKSLRSARDKIIAAAGGEPEAGAVIVGETEAQDAAISRAVATGLEERRLVEIEYLSQDSSQVKQRLIEPYLVINSGGDWYVVAWCRLASAERLFRFDMMRSARLTGERFEPREMDLEPYRATPAGREPDQEATVLFSPDIARFIHESRPSARRLEDGSLVDTIPYFSENWLLREVLKYGGRATVITPAAARAQLARLAGRLASRYASG